MADRTLERELEDEVARLRDLDLEGLRAAWRSTFRRKPADHLPKHLLFRIMAYHLQAEHLGELDKNTQRFLDQVALGTQEAGKLKTVGNHSARHGLQPGTILVREWNGAPQRIMVLDDGFAWSGATYRTLSEIAFAMTGTRWSGPRFFGLHARQVKPA